MGNVNNVAGVPRRSNARAVIGSVYIREVVQRID
jgi:hypothetical protein